GSNVLSQEAAGEFDAARRGTMDLAIFGISALMSLVSATVLATLIWPHLRSMRRQQALMLLVTPHLFLRFVGLSFLMPGVVAPSLSPAFAVPAAMVILAQEFWLWL